MVDNRYEIFIKTVELGSITKAALAMSYTQSGVSHAIAALEQEVGFSLLIRNKRGVELTARGEQIFGEIQALVNQQRRFTQTIAAVNHAIAGTIRVGTFASVSAHWLPTLIQKFQARHPQTKFELLDGSYDEIKLWIDEGRIDCGFLTEPNIGTLNFHPLIKDHMRVLMPANHPLREKASISFSDIRSEAFLLQAKGCSDEAVFRMPNLGKEPIPVPYVLNSDIAIMSMVEKGFGISILSELVLQGHPFNICIKPLEEPCYRVLGIAFPQMKDVSPVTKAFLEFIPTSSLFAAKMD